MFRQGRYRRKAAGHATCSNGCVRPGTDDGEGGCQAGPEMRPKSSAARPDGTILVFGADNLPMRSDEWFMANEAVEIFLTFCANAPFPSYVGWRLAPVL